jgi:hypothetical protein
MAHPHRVLVIGLSAAFAASLAFAQTSPPATKQGANSRITTKRGAASSSVAKVPKPDPDILDGSQFDPEKKPMYGMISEIELAGSEQKSERVGGSNQPPPAGGAQTPPMGQTAGGAGEPPSGPPPPQQPPPGGAPGAEIEEKQDDRQSGGPQGQAEGVQVKNLETPEGAASQQSAPASAPRDMQIGDATLQIQTVQQKPDMIGQQSTSTQQSDKKMPQGKQTDNRNRGAEKGRVMPKGL